MAEILVGCACAEEAATVAELRASAGGCVEAATVVMGRQIYVCQSS